MWDLDERDNIYFKMHCMYNAKTELYDRSLTDERDKYDPTSAFIGCTTEVRSLSNLYAMTLYRNCISKIESETKAPFDKDLWIRSISSYRNLSAQGWIDLYEHMVKNGEIWGEKNWKLMLFNMDSI